MEYGCAETEEKMVWAHTVGWNFNFHDRYDGAAVVPEKYLTTYRDRSLLGKWAHSDAGAYGNTRKYIDSAMKYGVDGFCIDIIFANAYNSGMRRYYQAAEGTDFKIALCIDSFKGTDRMTKYLGEFLRNWRNHPNNYFIDGKPVVFIYNPSGGMKNDQWKKVFDNLKKEGLEAHYIAQVERENSRRISEDTMKRSLELFGGIYDFGINGVSYKNNAEQAATL